MTDHVKPRDRTKCFPFGSMPGARQQKLSAQAPVLAFGPDMLNLAPTTVTCYVLAMRTGAAQWS